MFDDLGWHLLSLQETLVGGIRGLINHLLLSGTLDASLRHLLSIHVLDLLLRDPSLLLLDNTARRSWGLNESVVGLLGQSLVEGSRGLTTCGLHGDVLVLLWLDRLGRLLHGRKFLFLVYYSSDHSLLTS